MTLRFASDQLVAEENVSSDRDRGGEGGLAYIVASSSLEMLG